jgi:hypothetical protein
MVANHLEGGSLVDGVAFHQDALRTLGEGAPPECALEVVVLGKPTQHPKPGKAVPALTPGRPSVSTSLVSTPNREC